MQSKGLLPKTKSSFLILDFHTFHSPVLFLWLSLTLALLGPSQEKPYPLKTRCFLLPLSHLSCSTCLECPLSSLSEGMPESTSSVAGGSVSGSFKTDSLTHFAAVFSETLLFFFFFFLALYSSSVFLGFSACVSPGATPPPAGYFLNFYPLLTFYIFLLCFIIIIFFLVFSSYITYTGRPLNSTPILL